MKYRNRLQENLDTLQAIIYDIDQYGEADPIFVQNIKNEYDNVLGKALLKRAIKNIDVDVDYGTVASYLIDQGMRIQ